MKVACCVLRGPPFSNEGWLLDLEAELFIDDKAVLGLELLAILNEKPINDNYIIEMGTNVD